MSVFKYFIKNLILLNIDIQILYKIIFIVLIIFIFLLFLLFLRDLSLFFSLSFSLTLNTFFKIFLFSHLNYSSLSYCAIEKYIHILCIYFI